VLHACEAGVRWLAVAVRAKLFATREAIEPLCSRMNEFSVIAGGAVLKNLVAVLELLDLLQLQADDSIVLLLVQNFLKPVVGD